MSDDREIELKDLNKALRNQEIKDSIAFEKKYGAVKYTPQLLKQYRMEKNQFNNKVKSRVE